MSIYQSPWGEVQQQVQITPYTVDVMTASHGGLMITGEDIKKLSDSAIKNAMLFDDYLCYEEDCDVLIPINELPEVREAFNITNKSDFEEQLKYWHPNYYKQEGMKF